MKRIAAIFSLVAASALAQDPSRGEVLVYERPDFAGRSVTLRDDTGNLALVGFNDRAASIYVLDGTWEFCTDAYFRGSCRLYGPGQHRNLGDQARRLSSGRLVGTSIGHAMRPGEGRWHDVGKGDVSVFDAREFRGFLTTLSDPVRDFQRIGINDRVASIIVNRGTWEFCTHANFGGDCHAYGPGEYRSLPSGRDDAYSSARPVVPNSVARPPSPGKQPPDRWSGNRARIMLFDGIDFQGRSIIIDTAVANLEFMDFNDRARSVVVEGGTWRLCSDANGEGECHELGPGRYPALPRGLSGRVSSARAR